MNIWSGTGRITKDPEVRYGQTSQTAFCNFTLAIDRRAKEKATDYVQCVAVGKVAELMEKYVHKGDMVGITGPIQTGSYKKDDKTYYTWNVFVSSLDFLQQKRATSEADETKDAIPEGFSQLTDEDIPF